MIYELTSAQCAVGVDSAVIEGAPAKARGSLESTWESHYLLKATAEQVRPEERTGARETRIVHL